MKLRLPFTRRTDDAPTPRQARFENEDLPRPGQFRRNQTLSSYSASAESPRQQTHHLSIQRRKVGGVFLIAVTVVVLATVMLTQFTAQVTLVGSSQLTAASFTPHQGEYVEAINDYFGIHPVERLRFALNQQALTDYVSARHPEVRALELSGVNQLVEARLSIAFRQPVAGWQIRGTQYYVDSSGVVFERNYFGVPPVQIVDESGISPEQGTTVASSRLLGFVGKMVSLSEGRGYRAVKATLPANTTRRLDVQFDGVGPVIRFATDKGAGEQVSDMARALQYLESRGIGAQYLDVRVSGRAVYR